ncbi:tumor necrosis factor receptor superfamily member 10A-like isoform 2-T2 [Glossophaga mutica]
MAPPACPHRQPGPGALSDDSGQRALGRAPALSSERGPRPRLWHLLILISVLSSSGVNCFSLHHIARWNSLQKCHPGFYLSEHSGTCVPCTDGRDFTNHSNILSSCLPCIQCPPDKEIMALCTTTMNTQCRCKPGTFQDDSSPEFCLKCSPGCPAGKVEARPCSPWNNLECVDQESGSLKLGIIAAGTVGALVLLPLLTWLCCCHRSTAHQGCGVDSNCINRVFHRCLCAPRGPEAQDNALNAILSGRDSPSTPASEEELEHQEHTELADVTEQSPREAECLLRPAGAEGSQRKRKLLVPANNADPVESLRRFFDYLIEAVPFNSWKPILRWVGLSDNEIQVAEAQTSNPREQVYAMLVTWVNKMGRDISVNTLLDALESLGHRNTKEKIQDHLVASGKYVYVEELLFPEGKESL